MRGGAALRRWGAVALAASLLLSFVPPGPGIEKKPSSSSSSSSHPPFSSSSSSSSWGSPKLHFLYLGVKNDRQLQEEEQDSSSSSSPTSPPSLLEYDFYRDKCPQAEEIVRSTMSQLYSQNSSVAPALLRLLFHDCFVHGFLKGCDASVLLDRINGSMSEKDAIPNQTVKGFDAIDAIKYKVEAACPATVSCADILVVAARDGVVLAGGPFYPVLTGRRDSEQSFHTEAENEIPGPSNTYAETLSSFDRRGFTERETVSLLGAHSFGRMHCPFFTDRLDNFSGTGAPDGSLDVEMAEEMRATCGGGEDAGAAMGYRRPGEAEGLRFGNHYYRRLLEGRGILHSDQQLTAGRTVRWVRTYAGDGGGLRAFRADFARAMVKLSGLAPPAGSPSQVRIDCSRLAA